MQASGGEESSTDQDNPASAAHWQLRSKLYDNAKMQRKIVELEACLAGKAKATKVTDELRTCHVYIEIFPTVFSLNSEYFLL